jgi:hypothetical protein
MNLSNEQKQEIVQGVIERYQSYSAEASDWQQRGQEDREFRFGQQWTGPQERALALRGQFPIVVNRIFPAVEMAKALLTANRPSFQATAREDSDKKVANVISGLLEYMYQQSDGETCMRQIVDDYYVIGMGVGYVFEDPMADNGKGEVLFTDLDPFTVYFDPNARGRFAEDSEHIIISRNYSKAQAKMAFNAYSDLIDQSNSHFESDVPATNLYNTGNLFFNDFFIHDTEYVRGYEDFYRIVVNTYRTFEKFSGKESLIYEWDWAGYLAQPALIVEGQVFTDFEKILEVQEQIRMQKEAFNQQYAQLEQQMQMHAKELALAKDEQVLAMVEQAQGSDIGAERIDIEAQKAELQYQQAMQQLQAQFQEQVQQITPPQQVQQVTYQELIDLEMIDVVRSQTKRVQMDVVIGDQLLFRKLLASDNYPVVPIMNGFTRSPYPTSDVRQVRPLQEFINKTRSLIMAYTANATNQKVIVPAGSVDLDDFEVKWNKAGMAVLEVDMDDGQVPIIPPLPPLPSGLFSAEQSAMQDIDHHLGLYELMSGNAQSAPPTYKATIAIDEFGQRRIRSKLMDIEGGLRRIGQVAVQMMQSFYKTEKIARIVQPNNSMTEYAINKRLYDDKGAEIEVINDITRGSYDIVVVAGSTLPTNRFAQLEFYMDAYDRKIIDQQEVLKKTDVFDSEGVLQRMDIIGQLQQQLEQANEKIKEQSGDIQTKDRELSHLQKRVETEKFKADLHKSETDMKSASKLYQERLKDHLKTVTKQTKDDTSE